MVCKYFENIKKEVKQIGGNNIVINSPECNLKKINPQMQLKIYTALFNKGYERSFVSNICPLASNNLWTECPFFEEEK